MTRNAPVIMTTCRCDHTIIDDEVLLVHPDSELGKLCSDGDGVVVLSHPKWVAPKVNSFVVRHCKDVRDYTEIDTVYYVGISEKRCIELGLSVLDADAVGVVRIPPEIEPERNGFQRNTSSVIIGVGGISDDQILVHAKSELGALVESGYEATVWAPVVPEKEPQTFTIVKSLEDKLSYDGGYAVGLTSQAATALGLGMTDDTVIIEVYCPEETEPEKPNLKAPVIAIWYKDFLKYGCPACGCDMILSGPGLATLGHCEECGQQQLHFADGTFPKSSIGFGDGNGNFYHPEVQEHPRKGIPWHPYVWPDPRPRGGGEYWSSRGIGYDLSGFVKSRQAGERLHQMVKEVLGIEEPKSWLDYRPREPKWIQYKFQGEEFDLEALDKMARENKNVITRNILERCKAVKPV